MPGPRDTREVSYAGIIWLPVLLVGCSLSLVLSLFGRPRLGGALAVLLSLALMFTHEVPRVTRSTYSWSSSAFYPAPSGVFLAHVIADGAQNRTRWARELFIWGLPSLVCAVVSAVLTRRRGFHRTAVAVVSLAALPSVLTVGAMLPGAVGWSPDDPRWSLEYMREWSPDAGTFQGSLACLAFFISQPQLEGRVSPAELAQHEASCHQLCEPALRSGVNGNGGWEQACRKRWGEPAR